MQGVYFSHWFLVLSVDNYRCIWINSIFCNSWYYFHTVYNIYFCHSKLITLLSTACFYFTWMIKINFKDEFLKNRTKLAHEFTNNANNTWIYSEPVDTNMFQSFNSVHNLNTYRNSGCIWCIISNLRLIIDLRKFGDGKGRYICSYHIKQMGHWSSNCILI